MRNRSDFMKPIRRDAAARRAACRILRVGEDARPDDLKRAYRALAIEFHPDHNNNTAEANRRFTLIRCAYELLAFDRPCDALKEQLDLWRSVPHDDRYRLDSSWGHFCWWRDRFFGP